MSLERFSATLEKDQPPSLHEQIRERFLEVFDACKFAVTSHRLTATGPKNSPLFLDIAVGGRIDSSRTLMISSALHGIEGYATSEVLFTFLQPSILKDCPVRVVVLPILNPFGFAWGRRADENNVDLNRNFVPNFGTVVHTALPPYVAEVLTGKPRKWDRCFLAARALRIIAKHGIQKGRTLVVGGQHTLPGGLFFGGKEKTEVRSILESGLQEHVQSSRTLHVDFHTGLGRYGQFMLIANDSDGLAIANRISLAVPATTHIAGGKTPAYRPCGSLGAWLKTTPWSDRYDYLCAEFGTYNSLTVLSGLRAENAQWHKNLRESKDNQPPMPFKSLFAPPHSSWRKKITTHGNSILTRAVQEVQC